MLERARAGKTVVRLKGGDPFVFGRGGEEALALREAGHPLRDRPRRHLRRRRRRLRGHPRHPPRARDARWRSSPGTRRDARDPDESRDSTGPALAAFPGTLVFYMGVRQLPQIAESLIAAGRPAAEPVAIVERGTLPDQRTVTGTLADDRRDRARESRCERPRSPSSGPSPGSPSSWSGGRTDPIPARGQHRRGHPRARPGQRPGAAAGRAGGERRAGAGDPRPSRSPARRSTSSPYDLVCFTSPNAVDALFERLAQAGRHGQPHARDARAFAGARVAAIGPGTARALAEHGLARGHRARALRRRVARAGARRHARRARARGAREGGARRAPRRAARARRRG